MLHQGRRSQPGCPRPTDDGPMGPSLRRQPHLDRQPHTDHQPHHGRQRAGHRRATTVTASLLTVGMLLAGCGSADRDEPGSSVPSGSPSSTSAAPSAASAAARVPQPGTKDGVTVTETSVVLGDVDAPRRVLVYSDLSCPHCQQLHALMSADVERWSAGSEVAVELVTVDYLSPRTTHLFSARGANLLALVADESPAAWPAVLSALFDAQPTSTTDEALSTADLLALADEAGATLGPDAADAVEQRAFSGWVEDVTAQAAAAGIRSIPQVFVDGELVSGATHDETAALVREALGE